MLHDAALDRATSSAERRGDERTSGPDEIVIGWLHDPETTVRYQLVDMSSGGFRIRSTLPLITGTTGIAIRLLPEGEVLDQPVMITWTRRRESGQYDIGLRRL